MTCTTWTQAPAGTPAADLAVRPRVSRRAAGAFTAQRQGTGLPFGAPVVDAVAVSTPQDGIDPISPDTFHTDATTLGIHPSRRPPS